MSWNYIGGIRVDKWNLPKDVDPRMLQHTPGPWCSSGGNYAITTKDGALVPVINLLNARLIAAAPELLAALMRITKEFELSIVARGDDITTTAGKFEGVGIPEARAAIAKATGT